MHLLTLYLKVKNLRLRDINKVIIGNININLPRDDIPNRPLLKHVFPSDIEGLFIELNFWKYK